MSGDGALGWGHLYGGGGRGPCMVEVEESLYVWGEETRARALYGDPL